MERKENAYQLKEEQKRFSIEERHNKCQKLT
jgi:hypothetical protein